MKILVVEDTPTQAVMIRMGLQRLGYEVVVARDGIDAIEKVYQERPDLIVSDVVMPKLNGYQVCRLLKDDRQTAGIPVILLTSLDQKQDMFWGLKSGADKYITKGGDIPSLVSQIKDFIDEWGGPERTDRKPEHGVQNQADLHYDVMERVITLLDHNLFESTVISEIQNLVNILDDYRKTIFSVLEIFAKVIDFHAGCILVGGEDPPEAYSHVNRSVDPVFLDILRDEALSQLQPAGAIAGSFGHEEIVDNLHLMEEEGEHPKSIGSFISTMLYNKGRPSGVICLASAEKGAFTERSAKTFEMISRHANIVVDYARLYEKTKKLSITDGLTKVYNHRYFQEQLKREFARSDRNATPLSLIMLDIDHFKKFNDTYGHQQGDMVLQELAKVLQTKIRSCDILARYGGEEFAIIMPECEQAVCSAAAERLRAAVEQLPIPGKDQDLSVTISMGIAAVPHPEILSTPDLITAADRALYRAKENGRNRVEC